MRDDIQRLYDILDALQNIEKYSNEKEFYKNELIKTWIVYHLQIIGEATSRISDTIRNKYDHIKWKEISRMRNILVHAYFSIDLDEVWNTVVYDLPELKKDIDEIIKEINNS